MISIISAIGKNNEIGRNNWLLWDLPADMKHFRETTKGKTVIMGQKTFESLGRSPTGEPMGKPLPNRRNIIITRDVKYKVPGAEVAHSLAGALDLFPDQNEEIFIIGGGELYKQTMPIADKLYITRIEAEDKESDVFFPEIIPIVWNEISSEEHKRNEKNLFNYSFLVYEKI